MREEATRRNLLRRAAAVADLILRSAARTSRPWCLLMYALGYLWRRSGGRMALWSTDVLRPPKFDARGRPRSAARNGSNLPPACEIIGHAKHKKRVLALVRVKKEQQRYLYALYFSYVLK